MTEDDLQRLQLLEQAINESPEGFLVFNNDGELILFNKAAERIVGFAANVAPEKFCQLYGLKKADGAPLTWREDPSYRALQGQKVIDYEIQVKNPAVGEKWISVTANPLMCNGEQQGAITIFRDITEGKNRQRQVEELVREKTAESETARERAELYKLMAENISDYAICMLAADGTVLTWNEGGMRIVGYMPDEVIGKHFSLFYDQEARAKNHPQHELDTAIREGRYEEEGWRVRKDGSTYWANVVINAIKKPDGTLLGFSKVVRDLTEFKRLESEKAQTKAELERTNTTLAKTNAELEQAGKAKDIFLATMSHELRTPLNSILGFNDIMLLGYSGPLTETQVKQANYIKSSAAHLLSLINDILDLAKVESGKMELHPTPIEVTRMVSDVASELEAMAEHKSLYLHVNSNGPVPQALADERALRQIVTNLISNAIKFTDSGGIDVDCAAANGKVIVRVKDTGIGICEEDQSKLFQGFVQLARSDRKQEGTGLGLALSKRLAELMHGEITLSSQIGAGSCFTLSLPAEISD